jgi:hypothetical protein
MNTGHVIKRPSPMFKDEFIYQGVLKRPDGSIANVSDWEEECEAISFLTDRGIDKDTIKTTTEEVTS